jgi:hypothetical protein
MYGQKNRVLGNHVRIEILTLLAQWPLCVSYLIRCTNQRQAYISQQLIFCDPGAGSSLKKMVGMFVIDWWKLRNRAG